MNACDRSIHVTFTLNAEHFQSTDGEAIARVWNDNQPSDTPIVIKDGVGTISLSPKGITAVRIKGLSPKVSFQSQIVQTKPIPVLSSNREVEAAILSFGPKLRWLYGYLKSKPGTVKEAEASVTVDDVTSVITDDSYPFEFSLPIHSSADTVRVNTRLEKTIEVRN